MDGSGNHHVKQSKPDSGQRLHVLPHMQNLNIYNTTAIEGLMGGTRDNRERKRE
jgi:hypothetical protein